jgi:uncharacterized membrane protein HdeD (DUF308 family)
MRLAGLGTILMIVGVAVRVTAARHTPLSGANPYTYRLLRIGWSPTTYDIVVVIGWALLIVGIVAVAFALAREVRPSSQSAGS